ncbi:MAG TPA: hypothetical protein VJX94_19630, partial [Stellaceae bacterium]|nr:hypothetical protein [Stellaceae bacterium]
MVDSGYRLITEGLGVAHLRLVIGSSMGGMHAWLWAEMYPGLMDGVVPLSCQPIEISGRNWISRRAAAEAIRHDPEWNNGEYEKNPSTNIWTAAANSLRTESATRIQELAPTRAAADALFEQRPARACCKTHHARTPAKTGVIPSCCAKVDGKGADAARGSCRQNERA